MRRGCMACAWVSSKTSTTFLWSIWQLRKCLSCWVAIRLPNHDKTTGTSSMSRSSTRQLLTRIINFARFMALANNSLILSAIISGTSSRYLFSWTTRFLRFWWRLMPDQALQPRTNTQHPIGGLGNPRNLTTKRSGEGLKL